MKRIGICLLFLFSCLFPIQAENIGENDPSSVNPNAAGLKKNEPEWDFEVTTPETWTRLRQIQAQRSPEAGISFRFRDLDGGDGFHAQLGLRHHFREDLSLVYRTHHARYLSNQVGRVAQNLTLNHIGFLLDQKLSNWYAQVETGHRGRIGAGLSWERSLHPGAGIVLQAQRRSQHESLDSLKYGEIQNELKGGFSLTIPHQMFFNAEHTFFQSRITEYASTKGHGQNSIVECGFNLMPSPLKAMGWQFFDSNLRYPDQIRERLQFKIQQQFQIFDGEDLYFSQIPRTRNSRRTSLITSASWALSQHSGLELEGQIGQDLERDLNFGKIINLQGRYLWVPTHMTRVELRVSSSTENTGVIRGDILEYGMNWHVNL